MRLACFAIWAALCMPALCGSRTSAPNYSWPEPKYQVRVEENVKIPMRDGIRLSTDLYKPIDVGNKLPVILIRTPYNKAPYLEPKSTARQFAGQGYMVAVQDTRGRYASEGDYTAFAVDVTDGYDTTDWLSKQSWSNGKIGTYGCSYVGHVQILQAQLRYPNLTAMIPQAAGSSIGAAGTKPAPKIPDSQLRKEWGTLPLVGMTARAGAAPSDWDDIVSRELTDLWWASSAISKVTSGSTCRHSTSAPWYGTTLASPKYTPLSCGLNTEVNFLL